MKLASILTLDLTNMRVILLFLTILPLFLSAQRDSAAVVVKGKVYAADRDRAYYDLMIVNKRTHTGIFGNPDGSFVLKVQKADTLMFGALGLETKHFLVSDTIQSDTVLVAIRLDPLRVALRAVEVLPERTLKEIQKEIDKLGYDERDYRTSGVNALQSPITFLYESFSKRERSKRLVASLINEERKRDLLKELLHKYVEYDIINLSNESFDEFIDFVNVPESTLKSLSQYEFLMFIKRRYELYTRLGPTRRY